MKYTFRGLLTLLISLFILSGCENPSKVGLDVDPGDQILGALIDTLTIQAVTVKEDSVLTRNSAQLPLGYLKDPTIGETEATIQFALQNVTNGDSRIPTNATIDSVVLALNYGRDFFGDSLASSTTLEVKQLTEPYEVGKNYASDESWEVDPELYGTRVMSSFRYKDSVKIKTRIDSKDTTIRVAPQLRINLDAAKIKTLFDGSIDSTEFADFDFYHNRVKGFQLSANKSAQTGVGGLIHLAINPEQNGVTVYYKTPDTTLQKTKFYPVSATNAATAIHTTYTAEVQAQLDNPAGEYETLYAQAPAGLRVQLSLPTINNLKSEGLIVNKAELVIYTDEEATGTVFRRQAPRLTLYREDIAGQRTPIPDGDTRSNISDPRSFGLAFGGRYNTTSKRYTFILTSYIQDLLLSKLQNSTFYIAPASNLEAAIVPYLPSVYSGSRAVLGSQLNSDYQMILKIYYSKVNED